VVTILQRVADVAAGSDAGDGEMAVGGGWLVVVDAGPAGLFTIEPVADDDALDPVVEPLFSVAPVDQPRLARRLALWCAGAAHS
jgi:hypothetical protein